MIRNHGSRRHPPVWSSLSMLQSVVVSFLLILSITMTAVAAQALTVPDCSRSACVSTPSCSGLLPCSADTPTKMWFSLRRPTQWPQQEWFVCQCQSRSQGFLPSGWSKHTNTQEMRVSAEGGYRAGRAMKFTSVSEDALVDIECPANSGLYCDISGWSEIAWPTGGLISIWGGLECFDYSNSNSDSEMREFLDVFSGSDLLRIPASSDTKTYDVQLAQSAGRVWTYRASSVEGYSAHFADLDIDPAATSYYQDACTLSCGDVFGAYNAGEGDCLESNSGGSEGSESECDRALGCPPTSFCDNGVCKSIEGASCSNASDCPHINYECQNGSCGRKCISCSMGFCDNGFCSRPPPPDIPPGSGSGAPPPSPKPVCFAGSSEVLMADGVTTKPIQDVQVGEFVRSGVQGADDEENSLAAVPVVFLPHDSNNDIQAEYLAIQCDAGEGSSIMSIKTTRHHYVFAMTGDSSDGESVAVEAGTLRRGDLLVTADGIPCAITDILSTSEKGAYSLYTTSGTMVINGLVVSSYANPYFDDKEEEESSWYSHTLAHGIAMFHRTLYSVGVSGEWIRFFHERLVGLVDAYMELSSGEKVS